MQKNASIAIPPPLLNPLPTSSLGIFSYWELDIHTNQLPDWQNNENRTEQVGVKFSISRGWGGLKEVGCSNLPISYRKSYS